MCNYTSCEAVKGRFMSMLFALRDMGHVKVTTLFDIKLGVAYQCQQFYIIQNHSQTTRTQKIEDLNWNTNSWMLF